MSDTAPVITSAVATNFTDRGTGIAYQAAGYDPEAGALTWSLGGADAGRFRIDAATGAVTFGKAPTFASPGDQGADNVYDILVTASDGTVSTSQAVAVTVTAQTNLVNMLGGAGGFGEQSFGPTDDGSTGLIDLTSVFGTAGLNFFGTTYTGLWINNNGSVTFNSPLSSFTPTAITGSTGNPLIAPFWADVDTRATTASAATPGGNSAGSNLVWYDLDAAAKTFTVTWDDVGAFNRNNSVLNAFQLSLRQTAESGAFEITIRYEDVNWAQNLFGGDVARAGYTAGNGANFFEFAQSGDLAAMLALESASNVGIPGTFVFNVNSGGTAADTLLGSTGADIITAGGGDDNVRGGGGADQIDGGQGGDLLNGGEGDDSLFGGIGNDALWGGEGNDVLLGQDDDDLILGGNGDDLIQGALGADSLSGGDGNDTVDGGDGNDLLVGGAGADSMVGGAGIDMLRGGEGDDTLAGDAGDDGILGGNGADSISGGTGNDILRGNGGNDTIEGGDDADNILGGQDDDLLRGGAGADRIRGEEGADVIAGEAGADWLAGDAGADSLSGGDDDDTIYGGDDNDILLGDGGADTLNGGSGNDVLDGGAGRDLLIGGHNADIFRFAALADMGLGAERDVVSDLSRAHGDRLDLSAIDADLGVDGHQQFTLVGAAFTGVAGELIFSGGILSGDVTGDGLADFEIALTRPISLLASDLIL